jgi:3-oxoacyl-[acyl-carrier protein] reductase
VSSTDTPDRVALVTGGSGGIGAAICAALADAGCTVLVGYRSDEAAATAVAAACSGKAEPAHLDVTDEDSIAAAVARAGDLGTLTVLVNNAGCGCPPRTSTGPSTSTCAAPC